MKKIITMIVCSISFLVLSACVSKKKLILPEPGTISVISLQKKISEDVKIISKREEISKLIEEIQKQSKFTTLESLNENSLIRILEEPKNALIKQYKELLSMDNIELEFEKDAIKEIAKIALERKTGARGLRAVIESALLDTMFTLPSEKNVEKCVVTKDVVLGKANPILTYKESKK